MGAMRMSTLHVESTCYYNEDDLGHMLAIVTGHDEVDLDVMEALRTTGGAWCNQVEWCEGDRYYLVTGNFDPDLTYGDNPDALWGRLRRLVLPGWLDPRSAISNGRNTHAEGCHELWGGARSAPAPNCPRNA